MKISKKELDLIAHSLKEHDLSFIEYKDQEFSLKIGARANEIESSYFSKKEPITINEQPVNELVHAKEEKNENLKEIRIPIVGNIYFTKSPLEPQFVKVGDFVNEGDIIAIVEAMKVMNEVKASCSGLLVEICVENGTFVDANTVIMKLK